MKDRLDQLEKDKFIKVGGSVFSKTTTIPLFESINWDTSTANTVYVGNETANGGYRIDKIDLTSQVIQFATKGNNATINTYSTAWSSRASLTYGAYSDASPS